MSMEVPLNVEMVVASNNGISANAPIVRGETNLPVIDAKYAKYFASYVNIDSVSASQQKQQKKPQQSVNTAQAQIARIVAKGYDIALKYRLEEPIWIRITKKQLDYFGNSYVDKVAGDYARYKNTNIKVVFVEDENPPKSPTMRDGHVLVSVNTLANMTAEQINNPKASIWGGMVGNFLNQQSKKNESQGEERSLSASSLNLKIEYENLGSENVVVSRRGSPLDKNQGYNKKDYLTRIDREYRQRVLSSENSSGYSDSSRMLREWNDMIARIDSIAFDQKAGVRERTEVFNYVVTLYERNFAPRLQSVIKNEKDYTGGYIDFQVNEAASLFILSNKAKTSLLLSYHLNEGGANEEFVRKNRGNLLDAQKVYHQYLKSRLIMSVSRRSADTYELRQIFNGVVKNAEARSEELLYVSPVDDFWVSDQVIAGAAPYDSAFRVMLDSVSNQNWKVRLVEDVQASYRKNVAAPVLVAIRSVLKSR
jgi:hypothetical protein